MHWIWNGSDCDVSVCFIHRTWNGPDYDVIVFVLYTELGMDQAVWRQSVCFMHWTWNGSDCDVSVCFIHWTWNGSGSMTSGCLLFIYRCCSMLSTSMASGTSTRSGPSSPGTICCRMWRWKSSLPTGVSIYSILSTVFIAKHNACPKFYLGAAVAQW